MTDSPPTNPYPWRDDGTREENHGESDPPPQREEGEKDGEKDNTPDSNLSSTSDTSTQSGGNHIPHPEKLDDRNGIRTRSKQQHHIGASAENRPRTDVSGLADFFYPDGILRSGEEVVFEVQPTRWLDPKNHLVGAVLISMAVAMTVVIVVGLGEELLNAPFPGSNRPVPSQWYVVPGFLLVIGTVVYLYATARRASTWYILTQDRLLKRKGLIRREDKRVKLSDINTTNAVQPIHMYPFGVGHVDVYTAATGGAELRIEACRNINDHAELIDYQSKLADMSAEEREEFAERHSNWES